MRILIVGAAGHGRTEASLARAARQLGHEARVLDALGWRRRLGPLAPALLRWQADAFQPEFVLLTRHAASAGLRTVPALLRRRRSAFWYFDAPVPLPEPVIALARLADQAFATYGYQRDAFLAAGAKGAEFLPQGADPELDAPRPKAPVAWQCDLSFVGSGQYPRRYPFLLAFAEHCRLQVRGPNWAGAPAGIAVAGGPVRGAAFARAVRGATVSLGINALEVQATERDGGTSNRLWRVLASGGVFLTEAVQGLERFARDGEHVITYRTVDEGVERLRVLLGDEGLRRRLAAAGRAHVLARHTYAHRLDLLLRGRGYTSS
jgi:hypothetical protein